MGKNAKIRNGMVLKALPVAEAKAGAIFKQSMVASADGDGHVRPTETHVCCSCYGDGHSALDPSTHLGVGPLPFQGKKGGKAFHERISLPPI